MRISSAFDGTLAAISDVISHPLPCPDGRRASANRLPGDFKNT
jgi:hypothetical protein